MNMFRKVKLVCKSTFKNTVDFEGERYQLSKKWHIILYLCGLLLTVFPYLTTLNIEKLMGFSWDNAYFLAMMLGMIIIHLILPNDILDKLNQ